MEHPYHRHPLQQIDAQYAYANTDGVWQCKVCEKNCTSCQTGDHWPYHCQPCGFNLCVDCYKAVGDVHPLHPHRLSKLSASEAYAGGIWHCDRESCDKRNGEHTYHCEKCSFDLCEGCFHSFDHPLHKHPLLFIDTQMLYRHGRWSCVCCKKHHGRNSLSHHCPICRIDLCEECITGRRHHRHLDHHHDHQLLLVDSRVVYSSEVYQGSWFCDCCKANGTSNYMWHCQECEYDLCDRCIDQPSLPTQPQQDPSQPPIAVSGAAALPVDDIDDAHVCKVCMERPRNAGINHGGTSHEVCCLVCANSLWHSGQPCPICREKIDRVVEVFHS